MLALQGHSETTSKVAQSAAERFAELYDRYLPKVFRYISYRITEVQMAEDLTSVVFEKALARFRSHDPEKATFSTWIYAIARNTIIDYYRSSSRKNVQLDNEDRSPKKDASSEDSAIRAEEFQALWSFIDRLSGREQEIISLKFGAEMTNRQIARMTGLSESNVGTIIWRAVSKLRDNFVEWENG